MSHSSDSLALFTQGPTLLRQAVAGLSTEQLRARPIEGRWSVLEVVCHLADSDQAWCHRIKRVIAEDRPLLVGYDESRFATTLGYHTREIEPELALIEAMRLQMAEILRRLPAIAWGRAGIHTERGLIHLAEMVQIEAEHIMHHIRFIEEKRVALGV